MFVRVHRRAASPPLLRLIGLAVVAWVFGGESEAWAADGDVRVSSVGYLAARAKRVSVAGAAGSGAAFVVRRDGDDSSAFEGTLGNAGTDATTMDMVSVGDFSGLSAPGMYYVDVAGVGRSVSFPIGDDVMGGPFRAAMLGFYGSRCGTAVAFDFGDHHYGHAACHLDDGHLDYIGAAGVTRDATRGWHDAGDYGKYTGNGAFTLGMLLEAWERHADVIRLQPLAIPEAGGSLPDFLAELKWELDWLLAMQYGAQFGENGARVSHKLTSLVFEGFIPPEDDTGVRYFVPYATAATADFVAALAQASRVFAPFDADLAARALDAARASYAYLVANPANVAADQAAFTTGAYGTPDGDDRLWAAAEIWETTGDGAALDDLEARIGALTMTVVDADFDWGNVKNLGLLTYLRSKRAGRDQATVDRVRSSLMAAANAIVSAHDASRYGRGVVRYYWGSNGGVARTAMVLDLAYALTGDAKFVDVAVDQLGYLFGRNHYNRSQVTGLGIAPPLTPHHRPSASDDVVAPYPGLLVGGGTMATNWVDDQAMFMVNEVAVNWNGALVYALGMFLPATAPPPTPVDAGADAARPTDAGARDAGPPGPDAGSPTGPGTTTGAPRSSGCGCALDGRLDASPRAGANSDRAGLTVLLLVAAVLVARRRLR